MDGSRHMPLDAAGLARVLDIHRARPVADLDGLVDLGRDSARQAKFPVLAAVDGWLAGHDDAGGFDAAGCFLRGYWQEARDGHDGLLEHFLDFAAANDPERLSRGLEETLVFVVAHGLRRTASPELARRARAALARIADAADRVNLDAGARRFLAEIEGDD